MADEGNPAPSSRAWRAVLQFLGLVEAGTPPTHRRPRWNRMMDVRADTTRREALMGVALKCVPVAGVVSLLVNAEQPVWLRLLSVFAACVLVAGIAQSLLRLLRRRTR